MNGALRAVRCLSFRRISDIEEEKNLPIFAGSMGHLKNIIFIGLFLSTIVGFAQALPVRENAKWGMRDKEQMIIKPIYDTIFNFDSTGKVCLACFKTKTLSSNKFMKVMVTNYSCNYIHLLR